MEGRWKTKQEAQGSKSFPTAGSSFFLFGQAGCREEVVVLAESRSWVAWQELKPSRDYLEEAGSSEKGTLPGQPGTIRVASRKHGQKDRDRDRFGRKREIPIPRIALFLSFMPPLVSPTCWTSWKHFSKKGWGNVGNKHNDWPRKVFPGRIL